MLMWPIGWFEVPFEQFVLFCLAAFGLLVDQEWCKLASLD